MPFFKINVGQLLYIFLRFKFYPINLKPSTGICCSASSCGTCSWPGVNFGVCGLGFEHERLGFVFSLTVLLVQRTA